MPNRYWKSVYYTNTAKLLIKTKNKNQQIFKKNNINMLSFESIDDAILDSLLKYADLKKWEQNEYNYKVSN